MTIHFVRHAEKLDFSNKDKWEKSKRHKENDNDEPLSIDGIKSVIPEMDRYSHVTNKISYIYSSPFTRCIQTSLEMQKWISKKLKMIVPIRIEYGLTEVGTNFEVFNNFKIVNGNIVNANKNTQIDVQLHETNIYKKYGSEHFDTKYKSIIDKEIIKSNVNVLQQYNTCFKLFNKLLKKLKGTDDCFVCTSGKVLLLLMGFINKKIDINALREYFGWFLGIDVNIKKNTFHVEKFYKGL